MMLRFFCAAALTCALPALARDPLVVKTDLGKLQGKMSGEAGAPHWPAYDAAGSWQVMRLSPDAAAAPDAHRARYLFLQQVWGK